jgi:hypothetical protein
MVGTGPSLADPSGEPLCGWGWHAADGPPAGLLALGTLRSELVISLGRHSELPSTYSRYIGSKESEG